jgi:membrane-associated protease RseP (regulator of RpoE activity)
METTEMARKIKGRNGTLGGGLLRRFTVWLNYKERKITLKKNGNFKKRFEYNLSGIEVNYSGDVLVIDSGHTKHAMTKEENEMIISSPINFKFVLKPSYIVANVRPNSVADLAGVQKDDILLKINSQPTYNMSFESINEIFYSKRNKKIKLLVERNGESYC